jgi:hypothetical protein
MSETTTNAPETTTPAEKVSIVDTVFDVAQSWAAYGLNAGKAALQQSAKTLEKTAKALESLASELESKDEEKKA